MFKSFGFIFRAIRNKKTELFISLGMVLVLLVLASTLMYFLERKAQPEAFDSIISTMWWGVATLTTVGYGDLYPVTGFGKLLGGVIAILGVGLFALPAGIIASGFVEEIEKDKKLKSLKDQEAKLKHALFVEYFVPVLNQKKALNLEHLPRKWLSMNDIKYKMGISESTVLDVVGFSNLFRLRNVKISGKDHAGLEYIEANRSYGRCLNRNSNLTIINLYASIQPYYGHFSHALADVLQANYISNENFSKLSFLEEKQLNLIVNKEYDELSVSHPSLGELKKDLRTLIGKGNRCLFLVNATNDDNLLQFNIGGEKGTSSFENGLFFQDKAKLNEVYNAAVEMANNYEMKVLKHEKSGKPDEKHAAHWIHKETACDLLMLHVNVGILKKKTTEYYKYIDAFSKCLSGLK